MELCSAQGENRDATTLHETEFTYIDIEKKSGSLKLR
jgi:hypothetical protein